MIKFSGKVVHGDGYGKKLGFPTANIDPTNYHYQNLKLSHGIYAGLVQLETGDLHLSGIVIGPEGAASQLKLEAHLIDFSDTLYGSQVIFYIHSHIRPFESYETEDDLSKAIAADISLIKNMNICLPE